MLTCAVFVLAGVQMARAAGVVGTGKADSCTESALDAALDGGGLVTFDCGPERVTITLTEQKDISSDTAVDGGGLVTLDGNQAVRAFSVGQGQALTVENLAIVKCNANDAGGGGAIFNDGGALMVSNSTFTGNSAALALLGMAVGGAIYANGGTVTLIDSTFSDNDALYGGAIYANGGALTVTDSTFSGNSAGSGGAIDANSGTLTVTNSTLAGNFGVQGGAIWADGTLSVTNCTFSGNGPSAALRILHAGGAIYAKSGTLAVTNSTFASNVAGLGGAIATGFNASSGGTLIVTNSTFAGNGAGDGGGGAIANSGATTCGDAGTGPCAVVLRNTIVANSSSGGNCAGPIIDGGHNIDDGTTCRFKGTGCTIGGTSFCNTNPQLDPAGLANNGGPTQTIALESESPAVDAGSAFLCKSSPVNNLDQRGFARPGAGAINCSIGAYEFKSGPACGPGLCVFPEICSDGRCATLTPTATITRGGPTLTPTLTPTPTAANTATETPTPNYTATLTPNSTPPTNAPTSTPTNSPAMTPTRTPPRQTPTSAPTAPTTAPTAARTAGVVGTGTADSCTDEALDAALVGGGMVTFNCGGPATIDISTGTGTKTIAADTTIDGGDLITVSGGNKTSVFVVNAGVEFTVQHLTIANGSTTGRGSRAAIVNGGTLAVSNSTFSGNNGGGAIANGGMLTVANSTFSGNHSTASALGGAIANSGMLTVANSTFTGNGVGAIYNGGTLTVVNSTFSANIGGGATSYGGAIDNARTCGDAGTAPCPATLQNTIVANSVSGHNCAGPLTDGGHNIDDDTSCSFSTANSSSSNTDPQLDPLGPRDNGGPTQTIALLPGSPAIDAGNETICAAAPVNNLDQRGRIRPGAGATRCSIGAFEFDSSGSPAPTGTMTPVVIATPTATLAAAPSATVTATPTPSATASPTLTRTPSLRPTSIPTTTGTPKRSATATPTLTATPSPSATPTATRAPTTSATPSPSVTSTGMTPPSGGGGCSVTPNDSNGAAGWLLVWAITVWSVRRRALGTRGHRGAHQPTQRRVSWR